MSKKREKKAQKERERDEWRARDIESTQFDARPLKSELKRIPPREREQWRERDIEDTYFDARPLKSELSISQPHQAILNKLGSICRGKLGDDLQIIPFGSSFNGFGTRNIFINIVYRQSII